MHRCRLGMSASLTPKKYIYTKYGKRAATTVPWVERKQPLPCFVRGEGSHYRALYEEEAATTVPLVLGGSLAQPEVGMKPRIIPSALRVISPPPRLKDGFIGRLYTGRPAFPSLSLHRSRSGWLPPYE